MTEPNPESTEHDSQPAVDGGEAVDDPFRPGGAAGQQVAAPLVDYETD